MADLGNRVKRYGGMIGKGLMLEFAPQAAAGLINELFHQWGVTGKIITEYVQKDVSLWSELPPETKNQLTVAAQRIGNLDFITSDYFINSIRKDFSGIASLFLSWPEAREWLDRQIEELKTGVQQGADGGEGP